MSQTTGRLFQIEDLSRRLGISFDDKPTSFHIQAEHKHGPVDCQTIFFVFCRNLFWRRSASYSINRLVNIRQILVPVATQSQLVYRLRPPQPQPIPRVLAIVNVDFRFKSFIVRCLSSLSSKFVGLPFFNRMFKCTAIHAMLETNRLYTLHKPKKEHSSNVVVGYFKLRTASVVFASITKRRFIITCTP